MSVKKTYRVYCTYIFDGQQMYIGVTDKKGNAWEKYFGSNTYIKGIDAVNLHKDIIYETENKFEARMAEALLQLLHINNARLLNRFIGLRGTHNSLKEFPFVEVVKKWQPKM